jgi:hypothetical protein
MSITEKDKWVISIIGGILFLIVSMPSMYDLTNMVGKRMGIEYATKGGPTVAGLIVHTIVFILLFRLVLVWIPGSR